MIAAIRRFLDAEGFVEVETPILQPIYGGAAARPFVTHHNELDRDLYLRIATELYLKRLIVGGLERVYEIGKDFRNEGVSFKHNPEFTVLEWYEAYADYDDVARRCEQLVAYVAEAAGYEGELDFAAAVAARDARATRSPPRTGVDILADARARPRCRPRCASRASRSRRARRPGAQLVDHLLSKYVEPELVQPTFLMDYPVELSPFAKRHRAKPRAGRALGGLRGAGWRSPTRSRSSTTRTTSAPASRSSAASRPRATRRRSRSTRRYIQALEHGMPPTGGIGIGIDRLVMLMTGTADASARSCSSPRCADGRRLTRTHPAGGVRRHRREVAAGGW